ncbi:hypothetical protein O181_081153, partial [Austropuccinia psidii MF-1]|nr:hypothetical protein [Austropuccinia psidii MF-1]
MGPDAIAGSAAQKNGIPILCENNYSEWDAAIRAFFLYIGFLDYVDGDINPPSESNLDFFSKYKEMKQKAAGVICQSLNTNNRAKFLTRDNEKNPLELYDAISSYYQSSQSKNQARIFCALLSVKCKNKELEKFISDIRIQLMNLNSVGIRVGKPPNTIDISDELLAEIIISKLSDGYDNLKRMIYETRPLETAKVVSKIDDYIRDSYSNTKESDEGQHVKSESAFKLRNYPYCSNGVHNPSTKHSVEDCRQLKRNNNQKAKNNKNNKKRANSANTNQESTFEEGYSSSEEIPIVKYSKAFVTKCNSQNLNPYLDTAASSHMVGDRRAFMTYTEKEMSVETANGSQTPVLGHGKVQFLSNHKFITLHCLHVPDLAETLVSMGKLWKAGFTILKTNQSLFSIKKHNSILMNGKVSNNLFVLDMKICLPKSKAASMIKTPDLLHKRTGHPGNEILKRMYPGVKIPEFCEACALSKSKQLPYKGTLRRAITPGHTVHSDLSGKISPPSIGGGNYYLKLTDDFSRFKSIYILKRKSDTVTAIKDYVHEVERKHGNCVKVLVNDNGGEYLDSELQRFLNKKGIKMQLTAPYSPKQNPISERGNRSTSEKARTLLFTSSLPTNFWGEAVVTGTFLENITPCSSIDNKTPFELWNKSKFDLSRLRTFGCRCYVNIPKALRKGKFEPTSKKGIFLGYDSDKHNWRIMLENGKIIRSHDVVFDEHLFPGNPIKEDEHQDLIQYSDNYSVADIVDHEHIGQIESPHNNNDSNSTNDSPRIIPTSKPGWEYKLTSNQAPKHVSADIDESNILSSKRRAHTAVHSINSNSKNPTSWKEAMSQPDKSLWVEALENELNNLTSRGVFIETTLPKGSKPVGHSVQFKRKFDSDGKLIKNKVRICAQGFSQKHGVDYNDTFSPTGKFSSLRCLLTVAAHKGLEIHHMDAVAAFLNPTLKEEIYMTIPNFISAHSSGKVWQLMKPLYGLKQSSRYWYLELTEFFKSINMFPSKADPCLFISNDNGWECFVHIHVDDMTVASNKIEKFKSLIMGRFEMEDLGPANFVLGIKLTRNRATKEIFLSQASYVKELLHEYDMSECKPVATPMVANSKISAASDDDHQQFLSLNKNYRKAIGKISYLQVATRPDLAFITSQLSQFLEKPGHSHWIAFKHLLRYLAGTKDLALCLGGNNLSLCSYSDADYANCIDTRRSVSGYLTMVGKSCINWKSRKQNTVSTSSCEAEYKAQYEGGKDLLWSRRLLEDLKISVPKPLQLFGDNQGAISLAKNPQANERSKHFDVIFHWIQEKTEDNTLKVNYVATQKMLADGLTKALA